MAAQAKVTSIKSPSMVVESGVPMPDRRVVRGGLTDLLRQLSRSAVGDSVLVPDSLSPKHAPIHERCYRVGGKGWAAVRTVPGGMRVWKIAEPNFQR